MNTTIERSWIKTIVWSVVGLGAPAGGVFFGISAASGSAWQVLGWLPAIFLVIVAVFCVQAARSISGHAACPHCGRSMGADPAEVLRAIQCPACRQYTRVLEGRLEPLPEDWVDAEARFTAKIPHDEIRWPGCAMCGAPPTRSRMHEHLVPDTELNMLIGAIGIATVGVVRVGGGKLYWLSVPYCDAHDDCVELDFESRTLVIRFRSLPVARAFCAANRGTPPA